MRTIIASLFVLAGTFAAQADILCTQHNGCRETGLTLRNNGGAYWHLTHCPRPPANWDGRTPLNANGQCRQLPPVYR